MHLCTESISSSWCTAKPLPNSKSRHRVAAATVMFMSDGKFQLVIKINLIAHVIVFIAVKLDNLTVVADFAFH